jgi:hypothetical protein
MDQGLVDVPAADRAGADPVAMFLGTMPPDDPPPRHAEPGRLELETLIVDLSSRFIDLPPREVDREVEDGLRRVCEPLGIDLSVLWQWSAAAPGVIGSTHAHCAEEGLRPTDPMRQEQYPWSIEQVLAGLLITACATRLLRGGTLVFCQGQVVGNLDVVNIHLLPVARPSTLA